MTLITVYGHRMFAGSDEIKRIRAKNVEEIDRFLESVKSFVVAVDGVDPASKTQERTMFVKDLQSNFDRLAAQLDLFVRMNDGHPTGVLARGFDRNDVGDIVGD